MPIDPPRLQRHKETLAKVQASGWGGARTLPAGVDRLIALAVAGLRIASAGDVGRQRRIALRVDGLVAVLTVQIKGQFHLARIADVDNQRVKNPLKTSTGLVPKPNPIANAQP